MYNIILASGSPRRTEILKQAGVLFHVKVSNVSEDIQESNTEETVKELSRRKAVNIAESAEDGTVIIGADTVVVCSGKIMGKPKDKAEAVQMIMKLQGKTHSVYTGVTLIIKDKAKYELEMFAVETKVKVSKLTKEQAVLYVNTGESMDKAGAYAIQGRFAINIEGINGDYYNVVGLPVSEIYHRLLNKGIDIINNR